MSAVRSFVALWMLSFPAMLSAQQSLSNADVLKMAEAKLGDAVIVAKIEASSCKFDTTTDALIQLKQAGLSDTVLEAMEGASSTKASSTPAAPTPLFNPNDPMSDHDAGIYVVHKNKDVAILVGLEPTTYSQTKSSGIFASAVTYGIHKMKWKAVVRGAKASIQLSDPKPTFYFYFERKAGSLSYSSPWLAWFGGLSSPNQFTLARFETKSKERDLIVGEFGTFGTSMGTRERDVVETDFEKLAPGIYKVVPRTPLAPGEYCFFYIGQNRTLGASGGSLFDFGLPLDK